MAFRRSQVLGFLVSLTALAGAGLIVALALQKRSAIADYHEALWLRTVPYTGVYVPELDLTSIGGDAVRLGAPDPGTNQLLYYFTTTCPYCQASIPSWKELSRELNGRVSVVGVSLSPVDSTEAYIAEHNLSFPVVSLPKEARRYHSLFRTSSVPATVLVNPAGQVIYARVGVVDSGGITDSIRGSVALSQEGGSR